MRREMMPGVTQMLFPRALVNAYLVRADVPTLVDTGTPGATGRVLAALHAAGLQAGDVARIVLTHRHADHAGSAAELARATGAEVHVAPAEAAYLTEPREQPLPRAATPLGRMLVPYVKIALPWTLDRVGVRETLVDGATVGPFRVIGTPGHTPGHVSLLWEDRGILFTGDAAANITRVGPHPAADDPDRARESFRRLAEHEFRAVCFGHGRTLVANARSAVRAAA